MHFKVLFPHKIAPIILFLIFLSFAGYFLYVIYEMFVLEWLSFAVLIIPSILILLFMLIPTAAIGNVLLILSTMELIFHSNTLELKSKILFKKLVHPSFKPFLIEYASIEKIRYQNAQAAWEITDRSGKTVFLMPRLFEKRGGEILFRELMSRIPESTYENDLRPIEVRATKSEIIKSGIFFLVTLLGFFLILISGDVEILRPAFVHAWQVDRVFAMFETEQKAFSDGEDGIWLTSQRGTQSYLQYWTETGDNQKIEILSLSYQEPLWVSTNESGDPIIWLKNRVLTLTKSGWQSVSYAHNLQLDFFYSRQYFYAYEEEAWAIVNGEDRKHLIHISAQTGEWFDTPTPIEASNMDLALFSIYSAKQGTFLVTMGNEDNFFVYRLSNNVWQKEKFDLSIITANKASSIDDMLMHDDGNLYVLSNHLEKNWKITKISSSGTVTESNLPPLPKDFDRYEKLYLDTHNRIWLLGSYPNFIAIYEPVWDGGEAILKVGYSTKNSNFQADISGRPILLTNGTLVSVDDQISFIDTTWHELPRPLPDWLVNIAENRIGSFIVIAAQLAMLLILHNQKKSQQGDVK